MELRSPLAATHVPCGDRSQERRPLRLDEFFSAWRDEGNASRVIRTRDRRRCRSEGRA